MHRLTIYGPDLHTVVRTTDHATRHQAERSIADYERRHGRAAHSIDALPMPAPDDAQGWDDYRQRHGGA